MAKIFTNRDRRDLPFWVGVIVMNLPFCSLKSLEQLNAAINAEIRTIDEEDYRTAFEKDVLLGSL